MTLCYLRANERSRDRMRHFRRTEIGVVVSDTDDAQIVAGMKITCLRGIIEYKSGYRILARMRR